MRCARLLAYLMMEFEVPVITRHAMRCANIFISGAIDFQKLKLYPSSLVSDLSKEIDLNCNNKFLLASLRKIGNSILGNQKQQEPKAKVKQIEPKSAETAAEESEVQPEEEQKFVVYANINSQIEDYTFLITALYHWEQLHPAIKPTQPTDPSKFV